MKTFIIYIVLISSLFFAGITVGSLLEKNRQNKIDIENEKKVLKLINERDSANELLSKKVFIKYVDRIKYVEKTAPKNTEIVNDNSCIVSIGFVRKHNQARAGIDEMPEAFRNFDESPSGINLNTVSSIISENYTRCRKNAEQLKTLQEWVNGIK